MKSFSQYVTEKRSILEKSELQQEYQDFFMALLSKYKVESPAELSDDKKNEFFDEIKKHYEAGEGVKKSGQEIIDNNK
jgi:hypothetical protein